MICQRVEKPKLDLRDKKKDKFAVGPIERGVKRKSSMARGGVRRGEGNCRN